MGFQISAVSRYTDLKVSFDADKIFLEEDIIHAPLANSEEEVKTIYENILATALSAKVESLELTIMHGAVISEIDVYPIVFELINDFLSNNELNITLNVEKSYLLYQNQKDIESKLFSDISSFTSDLQLDYSGGQRFHHRQFRMLHNPARSRKLLDFYSNDDETNNLETELDDVLKNNNQKSFYERLIEYIDLKNYTKDSDVYNKAFVDRRVYHNIKSNRDYLPKKNTVILFALALELNEEEANDLLSYAGYTFSSTKRDQIILYCIRNKYYKIMYINGYLFDKGFLPLLNNSD